MTAPIVPMPWQNSGKQRSVILHRELTRGRKQVSLSQSPALCLALRGTALLVASTCLISCYPHLLNHPFHTLSIFLRKLSSFLHGLYFLLQVINGSILCDLAETFDTGHFLEFSSPWASVLPHSPPASLNTPSQPPSWNLLPLSPSGPSVSVVSRVPCTVHFSLFLGHIIPNFGFYCRWSFDEF